jgi:metallo-beta-lactamase family protein
MLYFIRQIKEKKLVSGHDGFEVYVDSPLANKATTVYSEHNADCFDDEALELVKKGINPISFDGLRLAVTADESKMINFDTKPKVILSASGMCEAGRIKHHLKHNLWRKESTILFVGYQAEGTLGRALLEGKKEVTLFGEPISVAAEICVLPGVSGHADQNGLLDWAGGFTVRPKKVFVVHGDDQVVQPFADLLKEKYGWDTMAPYSGTEYDLTQNVCVKETKGIPAEKKTEEGAASALGSGVAAASAASSGRQATVYGRLLAAGSRLLAIIKRSEGHPNKELAKFADQLEALNSKWDS